MCLGCKYPNMPEPGLLSSKTKNQAPNYVESQGQTMRKAVCFAEKTFRDYSVSIIFLNRTAEIYIFNQRRI